MSGLHECEVYFKQHCLCTYSQVVIFPDFGTLQLTIRKSRLMNLRNRWMGRLGDLLPILFVMLCMCEFFLPLRQPSQSSSS